MRPSAPLRSVTNRQRRLWLRYGDRSSALPRRRWITAGPSRRRRASPPGPMAGRVGGGRSRDVEGRQGRPGRLLAPLGGVSPLHNPGGRVLDPQRARCCQCHPHRSEREVDRSRRMLGHRWSERLSSAHRERREGLCLHVTISRSALRQAALLALSHFVPRGPCQEFGELRTHRRLVESFARQPVSPDYN